MLLAGNSAKHYQRLVRVIEAFTGTILICSVNLKAATLTELAAITSEFGFPAWASLLLIQVELALGVLLIAGAAGSIGRISSLFAFVLFACFSAYRALSGYESCGCFGSVKVHPWISFTLDLFIIALLAWSIRQSPAAPFAPRRRVAFAMLSWLLLGGTAFGLSYAFQPQTLAAGGDLAISEGGLIILEPETWGGKRMPIAKHISPSSDLNESDWTLLLYHHDCPDCQAALPYYQQLAERLREEGDAHRLLLIEIPPYGPDSQHNSAIVARLSDKVEWFVQAPVEIQVSNGIVRQASRDLPSIAAFRGQIDDRGSATMVRAAKPIVD